LNFTSCFTATGRSYYCGTSSVFRENYEDLGDVVKKEQPIYPLLLLPHAKISPDSDKAREKTAPQDIYLICGSLGIVTVFIT
jgi:hypothetical protein